MIRRAAIRRGCPSEFNLRYDRVITRIEGNRVFLDAPLATSFDAQFGGGTLRRYTWIGPHSKRRRRKPAGRVRLQPGRNQRLRLHRRGPRLDVCFHRSSRKTCGFATAWRSISATRPALANDDSKWFTVDNVINEEPVSIVTGEPAVYVRPRRPDGLCHELVGPTKGGTILSTTAPPATAGPNVFHNSTATNARERHRAAPSLVHRHAVRQHHGAGQPDQRPQPRRLRHVARLVGREHGGLELDGQQLLRAESADVAKLADRLDRHDQQRHDVWPAAARQLRFARHEGDGRRRRTACTMPKRTTRPTSACSTGRQRSGNWNDPLAWQREGKAGRVRGPVCAITCSATSTTSRTTAPAASISPYIDPAWQGRDPWPARRIRSPASMTQLSNATWRSRSNISSTRANVSFTAFWR